MDQPRSDVDPETTPCGRRAAAYAPTRRAVFGGVVGLAGVPLVAACSTGAGGSEEETAAAEPVSGIPTSDVPVGSGVILADQDLVLTQPTEGDYRAFDAACTHRGCPVTEIDEAGITCTCHGSVFSLEDGSPVSGPADEPLAERTVSIDGDSLSVT